MTQEDKPLFTKDTLDPTVGQALWHCVLYVVSPTYRKKCRDYQAIVREL